MELPRVKLIATGGTIAMTGTPAHPAVGADELLAAVPAIAAVASLEVEDLSNVPGANLAPAAAARAVAAAASGVEAGAAGAVITQGTDTIEETAELADLVWPHGAPLVITGAIRTGGTVSADGPLNLLDAIRVATSPLARGLGAMVVFDGVVHPGDEAVKSHSWRSDAFSSEAPLGHVREGEFRLLRQRSRTPLASPVELAAAPLDAYVPIVAAGAGMDSRPLDALREAGAAAIVLMALGAGHVPEAMLPGVDRALDAGLPLIVCARPEHGGTLERTYGFAGSETDLVERGAILAGAASPWKARIRVMVALALGRPAGFYLAGLRAVG
jgi:L-asparaginase